MMILVHASPTTLEQYRRPNLGVLSSPRRFYTNIDGWQWAADNDAFSKWDEGRYRAMLNGITGLPGCLFVTAPDVVGDWRETMKRFLDWHPRLREVGQPIALVAQDGLKPGAAPWVLFDALFIGGSSEWKMGEGAAILVREAKTRGKWVHMGRVNSHQRVRYAKALGCDSIDGTSFSWFKDRWLRDYLGHASGPAQMLLDAS